MMIFRHDSSDPWEPPSGTLRARLQPGALRLVDADGTRCQYYSSDAIQEIEVNGLVSAEGSISLSDLSITELQEIVTYLDVDTSAQTSSGLRRAIERHLEEG